MGVLDALMHGFGVALEPARLLYCFVGVLVGTLVGILPGLGPAATIALLLPVTYHLDTVSAIIMLAGIYTAASTAARPPRSCCAFLASRRR